MVKRNVFCKLTWKCLQWTCKHGLSIAGQVFLVFTCLLGPLSANFWTKLHYISLQRKEWPLQRNSTIISNYKEINWPLWRITTHNWEQVFQKTVLHEDYNMATLQLYGFLPNRRNRSPRYAICKLHLRIGRSRVPDTKSVNYTSESECSWLL